MYTCTPWWGSARWKKHLGSRSQPQQFKQSLYICEVLWKIIFYHIWKNFSLFFFSRLRTETQIMDHICSLPQDYGIQMKFNSLAAQGEKQLISVPILTVWKVWLTDSVTVQPPAYLCIQKIHKSFHLYLTFKQIWGRKNMSDYKQFQQLRFFPFVRGITGRGKLICTLYYSSFHLLSP